MKASMVNYSKKRWSSVQYPVGGMHEPIITNARPEDVFACMDDVGRRGRHMLGMGRPFRPEILSVNDTDVGATYCWTGTMCGVKFGWTEVVAGWVKNREKFHHSIEARGWITEIDMGWTLSPQDGGALLTEIMDYELGHSLVGKLLDWFWLKRYRSEGSQTGLQRTDEELERPRMAAEVIA